MILSFDILSIGLLKVNSVYLLFSCFEKQKMAYYPIVNHLVVIAT